MRELFIALVLVTTPFLAPVVFPVMPASFVPSGHPDPPSQLTVLDIGRLYLELAERVTLAVLGCANE